MVETRARTLLIERLEGARQSDLALELGVRQGRISQWKTGHSRPEPHYREALRILLGIPPLEWLTPDELLVITRVQTKRRPKRRRA
jgi:transcriptional regulator with XRE-family HTH domain